MSKFYSIDKQFILLIDKMLTEQDDYISTEEILDAAIERGIIDKEAIEPNSYAKKSTLQRLKEAKSKIKGKLQEHKSELDEVASPKDARKNIFRYPNDIRKRIKAGEIDIVADLVNDKPKFRDQQLKELLAASKGLLPSRLYAELCLCELKRHNSKTIVEFDGNERLRNIELLPELFVYIRDKEVMSFDYKPYGKPKRHVLLHPHLLKEFNNRWFIFGLAIQDDGEFINNYALDRICEDTIVYEKDITYVSAQEKRIDYNHYFDDIVGVSHRNNAKEIEIIIQTNDLYTHERIISKPIHSSRQSELMPFDKDKRHGEICLRLKPNLELLGALLSFGHHITIKSPKEYKEKVEQEVTSIFSNYKNIQERKESFLYDSTNVEKHPLRESIMDYVISWTLRRAQSKFCNEDVRLYSYCKQILCKIMGIGYDKNLLFTKVEVWKQEEHTDLWVEVEMEMMTNTKERHCILIEDKVYTPFAENKAIEYKRKFDEYYEDKDTWHPHYAVITVIAKNDANFEKYSFAKELGYTVFDIRELHYKNLPLTSNDIFNEFWNFL